MAKKVKVNEEEKKAKKMKTETVKEEKVEKNEEIDEVIDDEFDDEDLIERENKETKKDSLKKRKKRNKEALGDTFSKENAEIIGFFKVLIAVALFVLIFYLIVAFIKGDFKSKDRDKDPATSIQNDEILASSTFSKADKNYWVLFYDSKDTNAELYASIYSDYREKHTDVPMFWVNLNNKFNKDIVSEKTNEKANDYKDLAVSSPTLIHVKNGDNVDYYEGDKALDKLMSLVK